MNVTSISPFSVLCFSSLTWLVPYLAGLASSLCKFATSSDCSFLRQVIKGSCSFRLPTGLALRISMSLCSVASVLFEPFGSTEVLGLTMMPFFANSF